MARSNMLVVVSILCFAALCMSQTCTDVEIGDWQQIISDDPTSFEECINCKQIWGNPCQFEGLAIPDKTDKRWVAAPDAKAIGFSDAELLKTCNTNSSQGYTVFFQTVLKTSGYTKIKSLELNVTNVDDSAMVKMYNDRFPRGKTYPRLFSKGDFAEARAQGVLDLTYTLERDAKTAEQRIVIILIDSCPPSAAINAVVIPTISCRCGDWAQGCCVDEEVDCLKGNCVDGKCK